MIGSYGTGGKERQLAELIKILPQDQFDIHLVVKKEETYYIIDLKNKLSSFYSLERTRFGLSSIPLLKKHIRKINPDIVHSWEAATSVFAIIIKILLRGKYKTIDGSIRQAPASYNLFSLYRVERWFIQAFSNFIIGNSKAGLSIYNAPPSKSKCVYNGFDIQRVNNITPLDVVKKTFLIQTKYVIGMVARFEPEKDWETFLTTAIKIVTKRQDVSFLAVGDGSMISMYKNVIEDSFKTRIIFTGHQKNVESIVNCFDIGILTSNSDTYGEGLSNSILEYMASAKPVIATNCGGTSELINNEVNGYLIPPKDPAILEIVIESLLRDKTKRTNMGLKGLHKVKTEFSLERMGSDFINIYQSLIKR